MSLVIFMALSGIPARADNPKIGKLKPGATESKVGGAGAESERPAEAPGTPKPDIINFRPLNMSEPATSMALSEDGRFLVVTHQAADTVSIWDAGTLAQIKTLETAAPRSVLCRGQGIYVANFGKGTVSYFSEKNDWELVNQFEVDKPDVVHLSAARGSAFTGMLLAVCHPPGVQGSYQGPVVFSVDTKKDKVKAVGGYAVASVSCDGKLVMTQESFNLSPSGGLSLFNFTDFLGQKAKPIAQGGVQQTPFVFQVHPGSYWIGDHIVFAGSPIQVLSDKDLGNILIPDHSCRAIYPLTKERLFARKLDTELSEIGSRKVSFPKETEAAFEGVYHTIYRRRSYLLDYPIAWTEGNELRLFVLDFNRNVVLTAVTPAFASRESRVPNRQVIPEVKTGKGRPTAPAGADLAEKPGELGLPERVLVDQKVSVQLKGADKAEYELLSGPDGMTLSKSGLLTWTAMSGQVGVQKLKIRVKDGKKIQFVRPSIEVLEKDMASATAVAGDQPEAFDRVDLDVDRVELTHGGDYRSLLLLQGDRLRVLESDGLAVKRDATMPERYHRVAERTDHYVALTQQPPRLDLIDKQTHTIRKSVPIARSGIRVMEVMDFALHPKEPVVFVTIKHDIDLPSFRILIVNEKSGAVDAPDDLIGTWVKVDPAGRYLYAGYKDLYSKGSQFHINPGWRLVETPVYGNIDWLLTYDLRGRVPALVAAETKAGGNGNGIRLSADGKRITYLSHVGTPMHSGNLLGWNPAKLSDKPVNYELKDRGVTTQLAFHPTLKLVAVPGGGSAVLFDRETGKQLENRLQLTATGLGSVKVEDLIFAPDGKSLIFVCNAGPEGNYLRRVGLRLTKEELATTAKGVVVSVAKPIAKAPMIKLTEFDAIRPQTDAKAMSTKEISRRYLKSVVVVKSEEGSGTGFVVGRHGYILTCAHVLPSSGEVTVVYQSGAVGKEQTISAVAEVVSQDADQDLALLKIQTKTDLPTVSLFAKNGVIESGEEATVIGNPGAGGAILTHTLTTGVVSNPARELDGQAFIQTSAAVNPGTSGGPMFNSRGQVMGLVVLKARIEGAAFAVPAVALRTFLENAKEAPE